MATLNTLRTRGGVIVSIVIGIALLSFLLGDFGTSGANMMNERKSTAKRSGTLTFPTSSTIVKTYWKPFPDQTSLPNNKITSKTKCGKT